MSEISIVLGLALLMFVVYKRVNMVVGSLLASLVVLVLSRLAIINGLTDTWITGFADFVKSYYLTFALCALFGKVMEDTGCAAVIAKSVYKLLGDRFSIYGCILATTIIVYGGVVSFVAVFTVYPIFLAVFKQANLPRRFIPAAIYMPLATYVSNMIPGAVGLPNLITSQALGTPLTAGATIGILCTILTIILQVIYFEWEFRRARKRGQGFECTPDIQNQIDSLEHMGDGNVWLSLIPFAVVLILLNVFKWNVLVSITTAILVALVIFHRSMKGKLLKCVNIGIGNAADTLINTSAAVAFGSVVKITAGFTAIIALMNALPFSPLFSFGLAIEVLCGACGSASGGLAISLQSLAPRLLELGYNPEIIHRVAAIAACGLDSLPHCGLVVTIISYCGMTHKESYAPICMISVVITFIAFLFSVLLGGIMYPL